MGVIKSNCGVTSQLSYNGMWGVEVSTGGVTRDVRGVVQCKSKMTVIPENLREVVPLPPIIGTHANHSDDHTKPPTRMSASVPTPSLRNKWLRNRLRFEWKIGYVMH